MNNFDFEDCIVEGDYVFCTDYNGNIYSMPLPVKKEIEECPPCAIHKLMAAKNKRRDKYIRVRKEDII